MKVQQVRRFIAVALAVAAALGASLASTTRGSASRAAEAERGGTRSTTAASASLSPSAAQALRTCADRWNQGNMLGWGPTLVSVSIRRLDAREQHQLGLRGRGLPRCTVSLAVHSTRDSRTGCAGEAAMPGYPKFCV